MERWKRLLREGLESQKCGRLEQARIKFEQIIATRPNEPDALHLLGLVYFELGQSDEGLELIGRAIEQNPAVAVYHQNLARALIKKNRIIEGARALGCALSLAPDSVNVFGELVSVVGRMAKTGITAADISRPSSFDGSIGKADPISIVVCSIHEAKRRRIRAHYANLLAGSDHEIIQIGDARSLAEGYRRGFERSSGEIVVFSHDDVHVLCRELPALLTSQLANCDVLGVAGTSLVAGPAWTRAGWPHLHGCVIHRDQGDKFIVETYGSGFSNQPIQAIDGVFIAARREVVKAVSFDEETFDGFHLYDIDFSYRAFLAGFSLRILLDAPMVHDSTGHFGESWNAYAERFMKKHREHIALRELSEKVRWPFVSCSSLEEAERVARILPAITRSP